MQQHDLYLLNHEYRDHHHKLGQGLIVVLFGDEQSAESGDDLDKRALIIMDPITKLIERGQDPYDVELT